MDREIIVHAAVHLDAYGRRYRVGWLGNKRLRVIFDNDVELDPATIPEEVLVRLVRLAESDDKPLDVDKNFTTDFLYRHVVVNQSDL